MIVGIALITLGAFTALPGAIAWSDGLGVRASQMLPSVIVQLCGLAIALRPAHDVVDHTLVATAWLVLTATHAPTLLPARTDGR